MHLTCYGVLALTMVLCMHYLFCAYQTGGNIGCFHYFITFVDSRVQKTVRATRNVSV